jgi:ABC-type uncharacterized transport system involved in gliding motility auxiliary subunit
VIPAGAAPRDKNRSGRPNNRSGRVPFAVILPTESPQKREPTVPTPAPRGARAHHARDRSSEEARPLALRLQTNALHLCRCCRFPRKIRPSVRRVRAGAFRRHPSDRVPQKREPTVPTPAPRGACAHHAHDRSSEEARPLALRLQTNALHLCRCCRFPRKIRPSV